MDHGLRATEDHGPRTTRDNNGRFTKGNPGGPGNPFARRTAALRVAFQSAVTEADMNRLADNIRMQAERGDVAAAKLFLSYSLGKPVDVIDPDRLDQDEWKVAKSTICSYGDIDKIRDSFDLEHARLLVETFRPLNVRTKLEEILGIRTPKFAKKRRRGKASLSPEPTATAENALGEAVA